MARADLLALTADDLIALSNPGLFKRAQKELAAGEPGYQIEETPDGSVKVSWADGLVCQLPANTVLSKSLCSCPATTLCRHLLRAVLAYQQNAASSANPEATTPPTPPQPWNPGAISDETLASHFSKASLSRARQVFEQGQVIEVITGLKPSAHLHTQACTVRFLVEGDVRYTHCDCTEEAPCSHVLLAVWAFRRLNANQPAGLIDTRTESWPIPTDLLTEMEQSLIALVGSGLANAPQALIERLRRLEKRCQDEGLAWPAEILTELVQQLERYAARDARFEPEQVVELVGELLIRSAAIQNATEAVPQLFIRGSKSDKLTEVGMMRLVGLGCGVKLKRKSVELASYMQNLDNGLVLTIRHEFDDTTDLAAFSQLGQTTITKGLKLVTLGSGQLVIKAGKRTASHQLMLGRAPLSPGPQTYEWEKLRAPLLAEDFAQLQAHLQVLPPACLRPRHLTDNFYVCPLAGAQAVHFSPVEQAVVAQIQDQAGQTGFLYHPYTNRGQVGSEAMLEMLTNQGEKLRFVAGTVRMSPDGPIFAPVALVFEQDGRRVMLQPWIEAAAAAKEKTSAAISGLAAVAKIVARPGDPIANYVRSVVVALADLYVTGLTRLDNSTLRLWQNLYEQGTTLGFVRFIQPLAHLIETLQEQEQRLAWDWQPSAQLLLDLSFLVSLGQQS
jgi:hypothetical protein